MHKEINDCKPQVIEHFVGQQQIVQRCMIALESAWNQGTKLPHILMQGGPGLGKTELSHILAIVQRQPFMFGAFVEMRIMDLIISL